MRLLRTSLHELRGEATQLHAVARQPNHGATELASPPADINLATSLVRHASLLHGLLKPTGLCVDRIHEHGVLLP